MNSDNKIIIKPMYHDAELYDLKYAEKVQDIYFYMRYLKEEKNTVLELMCGTGRIAIPLAQTGCKVMGIDNSPTMLKYAKDKAAITGLKYLLFYENDCRDFQLNNKFSHIILPLNSLSHLVTEDDVRRTFDCVKLHLGFNGKFFLDYLNPRKEILERTVSTPELAGTYTTSAGKKITLSFTNEYNTDTHINTVHWYYDVEGSKVRYVEEMPMRIYFPQELDALLEANGFIIVNKFGNYDKSPFTENSPQQLYVCRVRAISN